MKYNITGFKNASDIIGEPIASFNHDVFNIQEHINWLQDVHPEYHHIEAKPEYSTGGVFPTFTTFETTQYPD